MYVNVPWTDTTYSAGTGLSLSGTTFNHSNSITAGGVGTSNATNGATLAVPYIMYDAQGHVTSSGTHTHTINNIPQADITWGGPALSGNASPNEVATIDELAHNKFAFMSAASVAVHYSRDGGSTWVSYGTDDDHRRLVTLSSGFQIGGPEAGKSATINDQLRVQLNSNIAGGNVYCFLHRILIYLSTSGSSGSTCTVQYKTIANYNNNNDTWTTLGTYNVAGWSGWNSIPFSGAFGGSSTQTGQIAQIRLIFKVTGVSSSFTNLAIASIRGIAFPLWGSPSTMASTGHLYTFDIDQNATFPAQITATQFNGKLNNININAVIDSFNTGGWSKLNGLLNGSVISVGQNSSMADWNGYAYSSSLVFGCRDTKGLLDMAYSTPMVTFGGTNIAQATEDRPKWYFKLLGTSDKIYTLPSDSKTLAATDGSNATGSWGISVTGNAATATKWASAQTVYVTLGTASTSTTLQGGSSSAQTIGVNGVLAIANGGTGKTNLKDACNALINALDTGSSNLTSNDYVITQYVGGGTTTTTYHRRPASALRVGGLLTGRKLKVALGSTTDVTFDGTADVTNIPISGTLGVGNGGTGATTFTSGALLIGNGTSAVGTRTIKNMTAKGNLGWTAATTDIYIPTVNTLAYWDGRYNATLSNLTYCVKGAFGDASVKGVVTTLDSSANLPTASAVKTYVDTTAQNTYVTLITTQTITGRKTFSDLAAVTFKPSSGDGSCNINYNSTLNALVFSFV